MVEDKLPIGRIAFARSACIDWVSDHSKSVLISLASALILLFALFQIAGKFSEGHRSDFVEGPICLLRLDCCQDQRRSVV